ncbi:Imm10 family immunity protein [Paenibacillus solani]|uniref:Imm10 family immunity protein n=1 Tax=Paenibacillus solani TaxID=1705565 RepID=UPI0006C8CA76|nr:Imm10 family immunity protein [Paenibacillus solani]
MSILLKTSFVYFGVEDETLLIGFADEEFETHEYVLFQKSLYNEDIPMLNKVHITLNSENRSEYGGILRITLSQKLISIYLSEETARSLGVDDSINIEYDIDEERYNALISHFNKLNVDQEIEITSVPYS